MKTRKLYFVILFAVIIAALIVTGVDAMPPHPDLIERMAKDQDSQSQARIGNCPQPTPVPGSADGRGFGEPLNFGPGAPAATGNILCILIEFSDKPSQVAGVYFDSLIFGNYQGTVKHYYNEVSYGSFDVVTVNYPSALGWQTAPQTYAYYCNGNNGMGTYPQNTQKLFEDIVDLVDPVVNFANYDNNSDGLVDAVMLVHTGPGAELTGNVNDIWSHAWGITPKSKDGKSISRFAIMPEYWNAAGDMTLGVFAHEMGHAYFSYPDLYDIDYTSRGVGRWSLMAGGSWNGSLGNSPAHLDAWCRVKAGFATATNLIANQVNQSIPNVEQNSTDAILRCWTNGTVGNQYYLIENRQKVGYDAALPGAGLLIWHIDDGVNPGNNTDNSNEWYPGHTASGHFRVALEQADGQWQLEKNIGYGDAADPFPGSTSNTSFSSISTPSSDDYSGSGTLVSITNISASDSAMTADLAVSLLADAEDYEFDGVLPKSFALEQNSPNPFNPATRISFELPRASSVNLSVYNILGEKIEDLLDGQLPAGKHSLSWRAEKYGSSLPSGVYFYKLTSNGVSLSRKMLLLK